MKRFLLVGLCMCATQVMAATLPPTSPWLTDNAYLQAVKAGDRIVAVGDRSGIIYSDNQGRSWSKAKQIPNPDYPQTKQPTRSLLTDVCFAPDGKQGWAVGHNADVLATTNGGATWMLQYNDPLDGKNVVGHVDETNGTAEANDSKESASDAGDDWSNAGGGSDWGNSGGGSDWGDSGGGSDWGDSDDSWGGDASVPSVDTTGAPLLGVWCDPSNAKHVIAVGGFGYFLETTDGGSTWKQQPKKLDNPDGWNLYAIASVPNGSGAVFVVGERGTIFRSTDNGKTWAKVKSPYRGTFFGVLATGPGNVLAFGLQGNVWLTHNYGKSWKQLPSHTRGGINNGTITNKDRLLLVGNNGVLLQSDTHHFDLKKSIIEQRSDLSSILPLANDTLVVTGVNGIHLIAGH